jgi:hypothetical protein
MPGWISGVFPRADRRLRSRELARPDHGSPGRAPV